MIATEYQYSARRQELKPVNPAHPIYSIRIGFIQSYLFINPQGKPHSETPHRLKIIPRDDFDLYVFQVMGVRYYFMIADKLGRKPIIRIHKA